MRKLFTSESVTEGHPDKMCDLIADNVLDECLKQDENSKVACEVLASKGEIYVTGEITTKANINIEKIVRETIKYIGYDNEKTDIDYRTCKVITNISKQSKDITLGIGNNGAGDQGIMFGYACDETDEYLPLTIYLAHRLAKRLTFVRKNNIIKNLRPDGKVQITAEYDNENGKIKRLDSIVISSQHTLEKNIDELREELEKEVIKKIIPNNFIDENTKLYINPAGRFTIGGPLADSGLTGRKIIVDTYGGIARHGGGAFSGKDATKVDRSASYMARFLAKNIVANGYAKRCEIELAYVIGIGNPISIYLETFNTETISKDEILRKITDMDLSVEGIIKYFDLKKPIYKMTTNYGHFGKNNLPWEKIIKI